MKEISKFYTYFLIIYFPACIAFYSIIRYDLFDEILSVLLVLAAVKYSAIIDKSRYRNYEIRRFVVLALFYLAYSFFIQITTTRGVMLDFLQMCRPYMVFYATWVMAPQFNFSQRKWLRYALLITFVLFLFLWFFYKEMVTYYKSDIKISESGPLCQISLFCAIIYYLFSKKTKQNKFLATIIILIGLIGGKSKFFGECAVFIALLYFVNGRIKLKSPTTILGLMILTSLVLAFTWTKFNGYYIEGFQDGGEKLARPMSYRTAVTIVFKDYIPFGSGLGSFGTAAAAKEYSPLYYKYGLSHIWGLTPGQPWFVADAFYPTLAEIGLFGIFFFCLFWKRRIKEIQKIPNLACYRMAWMCFMALALESTADTSYLSGRGMGYFIILAICINSEKYKFEDKEVHDSKYGFLESLGNQFRKNKVRV